MDRFSDKLPDQYYYTRLQDAAKGRDESAEEFGDRVGNCVIVQLGKFRMRKFRGLLMWRLSVGS